MRQKLWYHIATGVGALLLLGATLYVVLRWREIPAEVATHYSFSGVPEGYEDKGSLLSLLALSWVMYLVLVVTSFFPQTWNMPGRPAFRSFSFGGGSRSPRAMQAAADMLAVLRVEMAALFAWLLICTARGVSLGTWFLPGFLVALAVTVTAGVVRSAGK